MNNICENKNDLTVDNERSKIRENILKLESVMLGMKENLIDLPVKHHFAPGLYSRELFIPKGVTLTGMIHKTEHICVLSMGEVSVYTEDGMKRLKASSVVHSMPGIKRVLFAHEDSVWINFHHNPTNEQDPEKIEEIFTVKTFEELEFKEPKKLIGGE